MLTYQFDTQLLLEGKGLSKEQIIADIEQQIRGDCLLVVGDAEVIKLHFHTNEPWQVLKYCAALGDIHDIIIENMERQAQGLEG